MSCKNPKYELKNLSDDLSHIISMDYLEKWGFQKEIKDTPDKNKLTEILAGSDVKKIDFNHRLSDFISNLKTRFKVTCGDNHYSIYISHIGQVINNKKATVGIIKFNGNNYYFYTFTPLLQNVNNFTREYLLPYKKEISEFNYKKNKEIINLIRNRNYK